MAHASCDTVGLSEFQNSSLEYSGGRTAATAASHSARVQVGGNGFRYSRAARSVLERLFRLELLHSALGLPQKTNPHAGWMIKSSSDSRVRRSRKSIQHS